MHLDIALDADATITCETGDHLEVRFDENLSTGYRWRLAELPEHVGLVERVDEPVEHPELVGTSHVVRFELLVEAAGMGDVVFEHGRSWEPAPVSAPRLTVVA